MTAVHADPIDDLEHGHGRLSELVIELRAIFARVDEGSLDVAEARAELLDSAEALREAMVSHFAREGEALFPFIDTRVPTLRTTSQTLSSEHDALCMRATDLCRSFERLGTYVTFDDCRTQAKGLEDAYATHAASEIALLTELRGALDATGREELRVLLAGL